MESQKVPGTVPPQPEPAAPIKKGLPVVLGLGGILAVIALANVGSLFSGNKARSAKEWLGDSSRHGQSASGVELPDATDQPGQAGR